MDVVHPIHDRNVKKISRALDAALPVIKDEIRAIIEGHCLPEGKRRRGSVPSGTGHWFNEDTMDRGVRGELKQLRSTAAKVEEAIEILKF